MLSTDVDLPDFRAAISRMVAPSIGGVLDRGAGREALDQYGQPVGDQMLAEVEHAIARSQRAGDIAIRWDADGFLVLLPNADEKQARAFAERVRSTLALVQRPNALVVSLTVGTADMSAGESIQDTIGRADQLLYRARAAECRSSIRSNMECRTSRQRLPVHLGLRRVWLAIGWALIALVVYLSVAPSLPDTSLPEGDKLGHVAAYAVLMFWFMQIVRMSRSRAGVALGLVTLGIGLELLQAVLPYRSFELLDMVSNTTGVVLGWIAAPPRMPNVLASIEARLSG